MSISKTPAYGRYLITGVIGGKEVRAITTDAECFDWLEDDSNKEKHKEAKRHAYYKLKNNQ